MAIEFNDKEHKEERARALAIAKENNFTLVNVQSDKTDAGENKVSKNHHTTNVKRYDEKHFQEFGNRNIGVRCGAHLYEDYYLVVIDYDAKDIRSKSADDQEKIMEWKLFLDEEGTLKEKTQAQTPSFHYYFKLNLAKDDKRLLKGLQLFGGAIDIKANPNGYVVYSSSINNGRMYKVEEDCEVMELPSKFTDLLRNSLSLDVADRRKRASSEGRSTKQSETYALIEGLKEYVKQVGVLTEKEWSTFIRKPLATCAYDLHQEERVFSEFLAISKLCSKFKDEKDCRDKWSKDLIKVVDRTQKKLATCGENTIRGFLKEKGVDYKKHIKLSPQELQAHWSVENFSLSSKYEFTPKDAPIIQYNQRINQERLPKLPEDAPHFSELVRRIYDNAAVSLGNFSIATALTIIADKVALDITSPSNCTLNLFFYLHMRSGGGKNYYYKVLNGLTLSEKVDLVSYQAAVKMSKSRKYNRMLFSSDEIGNKFHDLCNPKSRDPQASGKKDFILSGYSHSTFNEMKSSMDMNEILKEEENEVMQPAKIDIHSKLGKTKGDYSCLIIGTTQTSIYEKLIELDEAFESGIVGRLIMCGDVAYSPKSADHGGDSKTIEETLGDKAFKNLLKITEEGRKLQVEEDEQAKSFRPNRMEGAFKEIYSDEDITPDKDIKEENLLPRVRENAIRIASLMAVYEWCGSGAIKSKVPTVTVDMYAWAYCYVKHAAICNIRNVRKLQADKIGRAKVTHNQFLNYAESRLKSTMQNHNRYKLSDFKNDLKKGKKKFAQEAKWIIGYVNNIEALPEYMIEKGQRGAKYIVKIPDEDS